MLNGTDWASNLAATLFYEDQTVGRTSQTVILSGFGLAGSIVQTGTGSLDPGYKSKFVVRDDIVVLYTLSSAKNQAINEGLIGNKAQRFFSLISVKLSSVLLVPMAPMTSSCLALGYGTSWNWPSLKYPTSGTTLACTICTLTCVST